MLPQEQDNEDIEAQSLTQSALRILLATARYQAARISRTLNLDAAAHEDAEQDILLILLERRHYYDPSRGAWTTFVNRIGRQAAQMVADDIVSTRRSGLSVVLSDASDEEAQEASDASCLSADDIYFTIALDRYFTRLPEPLRIVAQFSLQADGDLAEAQRALGLSTSEFYRRIKELRFRLVALGFVARRHLV